MNNKADITVHDSELIGLLIDTSHCTIELTVVLENGSTRKVNIKGVKAFRAEDVLLQNVIYRILSSTRGDIASSELASWIIWATSSTHAKSWLGEKQKQEWLDSVQSGELDLVIVEPSIGALICVICSDISFRT